MHLTSPLLSSVPGLVHGFGTLEEPVPSSLADSWSRLHPRWRQVHGTAQSEVTHPGQDCGEADALYALRSGQPVAVVTADCVPILLARRAGGAVAAVHAGWRGTRGRVLRELWKTLSARGERPDEWVAAIGPSIGACCYEVSPELAEEFRSEWGGRGSGWIVPRPRMLDLQAVNQAELRAIGLGAIDLIRACTKCAGMPEQPLFHSYRREAGNARQWSIAMAGAPDRP
ncbi:MAG: polyphenol oxidase family protein [Oligoflexia bacterium]|nr:polyphenol oxidase family protein [Oligoflexia bacterium]